ncbi:hypothetical protein VTK73DRAFT_7107 [Phialemonium thermophilum]|uniref:Major facilitator superfamily (MFS) profile domain-containing protein n=1 Tax=Phialemonium thermophilum TaxID=223376 RepID=A0ABR3XTQ1_9PEZI
MNKKGCGKARLRPTGPGDKVLPPFPRKQLLVLALCRICEPIAFMSIFPYVYHMIKDFNIAEDESGVSFYAGMVTSAFTFAEFSTGFMWGRISDKVGRKPVLITGLAGTGLSVLMFGFAPNLQVALFARALGGLLNGNIGVIQTTVAELVTVKEHQSRAYTVIPLVWCLGSIIGPMIGGALAKPVDAFPSLFPPGSIWDRFPYLLPNLFSAVCVFCGVIIGILFLEETHLEKRHRRDRGLELGNYLLSCIPWNRRGEATPKSAVLQGLLEGEEQLPGYRTTENSPLLRSLPTDVDPPEPLALESSRPKKRPRGGMRKASTKTFTRQVVLNIVSYGILAFHTMTFDQLLPVFLSTDSPAHAEPPKLPFKFVDGFGYDSQSIGVILSVQGFYSMFSTFFLFPFVLSRISPLQLFRLLAFPYFLLYLITPYLVLLPERYQMIGIYATVVWKCTFATMAYPSNAILLSNSAPSHLSLGTINGAAASTASLSRAFGPTVSGFLYSLGLRTGYSGLAWWLTGLISMVGAAISVHLTEPRGRLDEKLDDIETGSAEYEARSASQGEEDDLLGH